MVTADEPKDFFISYTSADRAWAEWIAYQLEHEGYTTIIQAWDFRPGEDFILAMHEASRRSKSTVLVLSPEYLQSEFGIKEWAAALRTDPLGKQRKVIPVRVRPCDVEGLLGSIVYIDLVGHSPIEAETVLLNGVKRERSKPSTPVPFPGTVNGAGDFTQRSADSNSSAADFLEGASTPTSGTAVDRDTQAFLDRADQLHRALDLFSDRLAEAFPGVRGLRTFTGQAAISRLTRLLKDPLTIIQHRGESTPIWWWRGFQNNAIDRFFVPDNEKPRCVLGHDELLIESVSVYRSARDYRSFVYVTTRADDPSGVYTQTSEHIEEMVQTFGFAFEEMGFWNGQYVSRAEYDDGFAEIDGKSVRIRDAESRVRYLTPYNFFIASVTSVFNSPDGDSAMAPLCQSLLQGKANLEDVVQVVEDLELSGRIGEAYFWID